MLATTERSQRIVIGRNRESQIADALVEQHGLKLEDASFSEDCFAKVDRWLLEGNKRTAMQIKYRETGDDLLFEVYNKFDGWYGKNKQGRDMVGQSKLYAVLRQDRKTVVITEVESAKRIIAEMTRIARVTGWTQDNGEQNKRLTYVKHGFTCELRVQRDHGDGRTKMIAYIPVGLLQAETQTRVYTVNMPANW